LPEGDEEEKDKVVKMLEVGEDKPLEVFTTN
jgi:hypothetical protein